jgi:O-antigen/teichoic acid export membrane protein
MLISVLTERMSAEDYGGLSLSLTFVVFINQVYMAGLSNGSGRLFASARVTGESVPLFQAIANVYTRSCTHVFVLGAVFGWLCIWVAGIGSISSAVAVIILALLGGLNSIAIGILNAARWRVSVAFVTSADSFVKLVVISVMFYQANRVDLSVVLWVQAASAGACAVLTLSLWRTLSGRLSKEQVAPKHAAESDKWQGQLRGYGRTLSMLGVVTFAHQISDRWALQTFQGTADVGLFAALYQLGFLPFSLLSSLALNLLAPILFDAIESRSTGSSSLSIRINLIAAAGMLLISLFAWGVGTIYGETICRMVLGDSFQGIAPMLPWALLAAGLFETAQVLALRLQARMAIRQWMWIKGSASCMGIALNLFGAWHAGVVGLVGALLIFSLTYLVAVGGWLLHDTRLRRGSISSA